MIATDKGLRGGDSGGPAFNERNELVGVASYTSITDPMFSSHISTTNYGISRWIERVLNNPDHDPQGADTEEAESVTLSLEPQDTSSATRVCFGWINIAVLLGAPALLKKKGFHLMY